MDSTPVRTALRTTPRTTSRPTSRPTLAEVARHAGVSTATASRVLNRSAPVSEAAAAAVEAAAAELGYVRHRAPSAGARQTGAVAVVVFDSLAQLTTDTFHARVLRGAERELSRTGHELAVLTAPRGSRRPALAHYLCSGHVDGVLLVGLHGDDHSLPRVLQAAGVPVQCIGRPLGSAGLPYVDADNVGGAAEAVAHLLRGGRKAVATIAGPQDMAVGTDRLAGYRRAVSGSQEIVAYGDFGAASGEHAMLRLLDRRPRLDGVFAASDAMAAGALRALRRLGVRVPGDIALVGFDDAVVAQRTSPQLTTVRQAVEEMGARAAAALIRHEATAPVVLGTRLVLRESA